MKHFWQEIDGYFTFPEFYKWVAMTARAARRRNEDEDPDRRVNLWHAVEVGVYTGQSAAYLAVELGEDSFFKLDLVDIEMTKHRARENLSRIHANFHELDSVAASRLYPDASLDFVFIDADHAYESVRRDIDAWLPKVKRGGIIAGHDYCLEFSGVIRAVTETFDRVEVWRGRKGMGDQRMIDTGNYFPCWSVRV